MSVDDGVLRDVLSKFCKDFYGQCTMGNIFKVPYLCHDFRVGKCWSNYQIWLAKKIVPSWKELLKPGVLGFLESDLADNFLKYVSESEHVILEACCSNFESVDQEHIIC